MRIGNHEKVAENIHALMLDEQRHQWQKQVVKNGDEFLTEWATQQGFSQRNIENAKIAILWLQVKDLSLKVATLTKKMVALVDYFLRVALGDFSKKQQEGYFQNKLWTPARILESKIYFGR